MSATLSDYAHRFRKDRQTTWQAMADVYRRVPEASGWFESDASFSVYAVAQKHLVRDDPKRVAIATLCMQVGGYVRSIDEHGVTSWNPPRESEQAC